MLQIQWDVRLAAIDSGDRSVTQGANSEAVVLILIFVAVVGVAFQSILRLVACARVSTRCAKDGDRALLMESRARWPRRLDGLRVC